MISPYDCHRMIKNCTTSCHSIWKECYDTKLGGTPLIVDSVLLLPEMKWRNFLLWRYVSYILIVKWMKVLMKWEKPKVYRDSFVLFCNVFRDTFLCFTFHVFSHRAWWIDETSRDFVSQNACVHREFFAFCHMLCEIVCEILRNVKNNKYIADFTLVFHCTIIRGVFQKFCVANPVSIENQ